MLCIYWLFIIGFSKSYTIKITLRFWKISQINFLFSLEDVTLCNVARQDPCQVSSAFPDIYLRSSDLPSRMLPHNEVFADRCARNIVANHDELCASSRDIGLVDHRADFAGRLRDTRALLLVVRESTVALRVAHGLLIRRRTMEISFRGRGARAGRNNNLLTSHVMRRVILHPPTRSATSPPSARPFGPAPVPARYRPGTTWLRRWPHIRQPIVSAAIVIYRPDDLRFRLHRRRYRTVPGRPEVSSDSSARDRSYILAGDSAAPRTGRSFYRERYLLAGPPRSTSHFAARKHGVSTSARTRVSHIEWVSACRPWTSRSSRRKESQLALEFMKPPCIKTRGLLRWTINDPRNQVDLFPTKDQAISSRCSIHEMLLFFIK